MATKSTINKVKSKIDVVKKLNDDPTSFASSKYDEYGPKLTNKFDLTNLQKNASSKSRKNKDDIFGQMTEISKSILAPSKKNNKHENVSDRLNSNESDTKLIKFTKESSKTTLQESKPIILDELNKLLTGSAGICAGNTTIPSGNTMYMYPREFDLLCQLKVNPESTIGKICYEDPITTTGIKFNTELFDLFDSGTGYTFTANTGDDLFSIIWDTTNQRYTITSVTTPIEIGDFLDKYYASIEYPNIDEVLKKAMLLTIQDDGSDNALCIDGINCLSRLLKKLFSLCGSKSGQQEQSALKNNPTDIFEEDEMEIEKYFDFEDTEGIDLDDEDGRRRHVLKFRTCDIFEAEIDNSHIEDFVYLTKKNLDDNIIDTLTNVANNVSSDTDNSQYLNALLGSFISNIPKALMMCILSPKMVFPIIYAYKIGANVGALVEDIKIIMKKLATLFYNIIKRLFWIFINEFWGYVKPELLRLIANLAARILSNKFKKYKSIIAALIGLLTKILSMRKFSCDELFESILSTINLALNSSSGSISTPGMLLFLSDSLPGYSSDRAYMNIIENLSNAGVNTDQIYGEPNDLTTAIKGVVEGNSKEMDDNSYVKIALKPTVLATTPFSTVLTPTITGAGKVF